LAGAWQALGGLSLGIVASLRAALTRALSRDARAGPK
jgi:hypothetical protein